MAKYLYKGNGITVLDNGAVIAETYEPMGIVENICKGILQAVRIIDRFSVLKSNVTSGEIKLLLNL